MVHPCPADSVKGSYRCTALLKESWQGEAWPSTGGSCRQRTKAPSNAKEPSESHKTLVREEPVPTVLLL